MVSSPPHPSVSRFVFVAVVGVLPFTLVALAVAQYILNHFYARAPLLLDAGWLSAIVYRSGVVQINPPIACDYAATYYGVHVSPFLSAFSLASELVPLRRIEWYALFQALVHGLLALPVFFLSSRLEPAPPYRRIPILFFTALAFALSGQALHCIWYPHYEALIPALLCLLLLAVLAARPVAFWVLLILAISVREDAGFHAGLALLPLMYLKWRGVQVPASWRRLAALVGVAFGASILAVVVQKAFFHSANLLRTEYIGNPPFAHLTPSLLMERFGYFIRNTPYVYVPILGTAAVALARRDGRYLLGWASATPWLVMNFVSPSPPKWHFWAYTGFPFLVSVFWVYLYGALLAPRTRRLADVRAAEVLCWICVASTTATYLADPPLITWTVRGMALAEPGNRSSVRAYATAIRERRPVLGRLYVDQAVAAHTLESLQLENTYRAGVSDADTFAFHRDSADPQILADIAARGIDRCIHVLDTGFLLCSRLPFAHTLLTGLPTELLPPLFVRAWIDGNARRLDILPRGIVIHNGSAPGIVVNSFPTHLGGAFEVVWDVDIEEADPGVEEVAAVEVLVDGDVRGSSSAVVGLSTPHAQHLVVGFTALRDQTTIWRLQYRGHGTLLIAGAQLRRAQ